MPANLASALITKLTVSNNLDAEDIRAIHTLRIRERHFDSGEVIVADGDRPSDCCLIAEGFAFRSIDDCGWRTTGSLHPHTGRDPDLQGLHLKVMDHDLITVTRCALGFISHDDLREVNRLRPNLASARWRETLLDGAIFREWIVNVGRREATPRMAQLLTELHRRLKAIGHTRDGEFGLPITQTDLGDCLGLSVVHTKRVLQNLRKGGLVSVSRSEFHILKPKEMEELAGFDPTYLHLSPST